MKCNALMLASFVLAPAALAQKFPLFPNGTAPYPTGTGAPSGFPQPTGFPGTGKPTFLSSVSEDASTVLQTTTVSATLASTTFVTVSEVSASTESASAVAFTSLAAHVETSTYNSLPPYPTTLATGVSGVAGAGTGYPSGTGAPYPTGTGALVANYYQCGGIGYTGPTSCVTGSTCVVQNAYYSQCIASS